MNPYAPPPTYLQNFANTMKQFGQNQAQAANIAKMVPTATTSAPPPIAPTPAPVPGMPAPAPAVPGAPGPTDIAARRAAVASGLPGLNLTNAPGVTALQGSVNPMSFDTSAAIAQFRATHPDLTRQATQTAPGSFQIPKFVNVPFSPGSPAALVGKGPVNAARNNLYRRLYG